MFKEKILIFGDSYSSYEGCIPHGYSTYYPEKGTEDMRDVSHMWWHMLISETNSAVVLNNSWAGSTLCNVRYGQDCSTTSSFICRLNKLVESNFFVENEIDKVFVFGGTNDSWSGTPCGELKFSDWTSSDLNLILPGLCFFIHKLLNAVKKEKVNFIINTDMREEVEKGIIDVCRHYRINYILLKDIDKVDGHPTHKGMTEIKNQILNSLELEG